MEINARDARQRFSDLLDLAESGEEIIVTRRGKPAVRLVAERSGQPRVPLPDLAAFRTSVSMDGSLTEALIDERENGRN